MKLSIRAFWKSKSSWGQAQSYIGPQGEVGLPFTSFCVANSHILHRRWTLAPRWFHNLRMWKIPTSYCKHWPNELFNWVNPSTTTKRTTNRSGRREYAYISNKTLQRGEHTTLQGKDIAICTPSGACTSLLSSDSRAACSLLPDLDTIPALYNKGNVIRSHPTVLQQEETTVITIPLN